MPLLSIVIATFNSAKLLPSVLDSVKLQKFKKDQVEVLIVDGGSTDTTRLIAENYGCRIINNPYTDPVHAKFFGFLEAKGKYLIYLDHDEVLENKNSLQIKLQAMLSVDNVKVVAPTGYKNPSGYPFINRYINEFGDPFSFFIYRLSKDAEFLLPTMRKRYNTIIDEKDYVVFNLLTSNHMPLFELVAGATMIDRQFIQRHVPEVSKHVYMLGQAYHHVFALSPYIAITKNDSILHYSSDTYSKYLNKIKWRVKNNIFFVSQMGKSGFSGRNANQPKLFQIKQYLYIPYVFTLIFLVIDSIWLILTRRDWRYIYHLPLSVYTAMSILYYYSLKLLGYKPYLKSYDEKKKLRIIN